MRVKAAKNRDGLLRPQAESHLPQPQIAQTRRLSPTTATDRLGSWEHLQNRPRGTVRTVKPELRRETAESCWTFLAPAAVHDAGRVDWWFPHPKGHRRLL